MSKEMLMFRDIELKKKTLPQKNSYFLKDVDIEKIFVSNKISFGEKNYKYFIDYLYNDNKVKPLHMILPKASAYVKSWTNKKHVFFY